MSLLYRVHWLTGFNEGWSALPQLYHIVRAQDVCAVKKPMYMLMNPINESTVAYLSHTCKKQSSSYCAKHRTRSLRVGKCSKSFYDMPYKYEWVVSVMCKGQHWHLVIAPWRYCFPNCQTNWRRSRWSDLRSEYSGHWQAIARLIELLRSLARDYCDSEIRCSE